MLVHMTGKRISLVSSWILNSKHTLWCLERPQEVYLFANEGENHTNNVKQLEAMKKAMEDGAAKSSGVIQGNSVTLRCIV